MNFLRLGLIVGISVSQLACSVFGIRSEETPKYQVLVKDGDFEIRSYSPYVVAKTVVKGEFDQVQEEAFRRLAGYIFGANEKKQSLSMTAPVVQKESQKIAMTAPVVQSPSEDGWEMTFMMPSQYKLEDLPKPNDPQVLFEQVPAKLFAVIRYSGSRKKGVNDMKAADLKEWLGRQPNYEITAGPNFAGYDPPWTLPWFRRNEMMFELLPKTKN